MSSTKSRMPVSTDRRQRSWRRVIGTLTLARRQHIELDVFVYGAATSVYAESSRWSLAEEIFDQVRSAGLRPDMVLRAKALTAEPMLQGPSPGRFRHLVFWQLSLWCLNYSGRCSMRRADEIAEGAAWDWPSGAFLRFGNDPELIYTRITTSAGLTISDLQIIVPAAECREWNASDLGPYTLLIHMHDASYLELLLHITADENSTLFLGPSLDDGYEITLASEQGISSIRRLIASRVQGSTQEYPGRQGLSALPGARLSIRLSWQLLLGAGTLRIYNGSEPLAATQLLAFVDPAPPRLWSACPVGRSAPVLERDGTRPSECEETLQDVAAAGLQLGALSKGSALTAEVPSSDWQSWPLPLVLTDNRLEALENFSFMQGSILFADVVVRGVASPCNTTGCLALQRWDCFFRPGAGTGPCLLDFTEATGRNGWTLTTGVLSRASWTADFGADALVASGALLQDFPRQCGAPEAASTSFQSSAALELASAFPAASLPAVRDDATWRDGDHAFHRGTVLLRGRAVELLISTKVGHSRLRSRRFKLIFCPPGGACLSGTLNRIKFLEAGDAPPRPTWRTDNACQQQPCLGREPSSVAWPSPGDSLSLDGGFRVDYKVWSTFRVQFAAPPKTTVWVLIMQIVALVALVRQTVLAYALAARTLGVSPFSVPTETIRYVDKPGSFTLFSGIKSGATPLSFDGNRFQGDALLKFLSLDNEVGAAGATLVDTYGVRTKGQAELQSALDGECGTRDFSQTLVDEGLQSAEDAVAHRASATDLSSHFAFAGANQDLTLRPMKAGTLVACYCGAISVQGTCGATWRLGGKSVVAERPSMAHLHLLRVGVDRTLQANRRMQARRMQGPASHSNVYEVSWGFKVTDNLRLVTSSALCADGSDMPGSAWNPEGTTAVKVGCPYGVNSSKVCESSSVDEMLPVQLSDNLRTGVHIVHWLIEGPHSSVLTFSSPVTGLLRDGDAIYIEPNSLLVDGRGLAAMTDTERFHAMALTGMGQFQDDGTNFLRHWHYVQLLTANENGLSATSKVRIPVGWPEDVERPVIELASNQLQWYRSNVMNSQEEFRANGVVADLKVCWAPNEFSLRLVAMAKAVLEALKATGASDLSKAIEAVSAGLFKIKTLTGREILDSRGNPTVEVDLTTEGGVTVTAAVPSGASTGVHEACELRDGDKTRYLGKGVLKAVESVNTVLSTELKGFDVSKQKELDDKMIALDSTPNKSKLGANAILGVSMAAAKAAAQAKGIPLYQHFAELAGNGSKLTLPVPCFNVINGGSHAGNKLAFQEYFIIPVGASSFKDAMRIGSECYHTLKGIIKKKFGGDATLIGDEGGFAPPCDAKQGVELIMEAIEKAGYKDKCKIGMDVAASEFKVEGADCYDLGTWYAEAEKTPDLKMTGVQLADFYADLCKNYPLITIEDPFDQDDWAAWTAFTEKVGGPTQVVGDDLTVTNVTRVKKAIDDKACNALLLKVNQIGTVSESIDAVKLCKVNGWGVMCSHRSGETEDTTIADLAVGLCTGQIKTGAPCRSDRNAKYNQLMRIEEELGDKCAYAGETWRKPVWMA
ncbi:Gamma-enolase [Symbiodinium microadriaticum]|uniref:phosphopyruvate hydratase n=1 Tax=Symbiodinium microadriaticum TaxID=2951 RepID=A0A1Q9E996_SYMMI|nr:Gamma-enolase [Symbiodinium microadriaticum]